MPATEASLEPKPAAEMEQSEYERWLDSLDECNEPFARRAKKRTTRTTVPTAQAAE
jgi:hypothetical protein